MLKITKKKTTIDKIKIISKSIQIKNCSNIKHLKYFVILIKKAALPKRPKWVFLLIY